MLYEQLAFGGDVGQDQEHGQDDQEQEFVISLERQEWLEEFRRRVGELARNVPNAKPGRKGRGGTGGSPPHRPGYRSR